MIMLNKIIIDKKKNVINKSGSYILDIKNVDDIEIIIESGLFVYFNIISCDNDINRSICYKIKDESSVVVNKFYNNKCVNENIVIDLDGFKSNIEYCFSGISIGNEKYKMIINHNNKMVKSKVINHFVAIDGAVDYFDIDSNVEHGNSGSIMDQNTKIINLGENKSKIQPNMNIREYDVIAKHGSVIGKFREEDIFYLMSRGIRYNDVMRLLVGGFLKANYIIEDNFLNGVDNIINKYWR